MLFVINCMNTSCEWGDTKSSQSAVAHRSLRFGSGEEEVEGEVPGSIFGWARILHLMEGWLHCVIRALCLLLFRFGEIIWAAFVDQHTHPVVSYSVCNHHFHSSSYKVASKARSSNKSVVISIIVPLVMWKSFRSKAAYRANSQVFQLKLELYFWEPAAG